MESKDEFKALLVQLLDEGETNMRIYYEGGGDSGFIEEINFDNMYDLNKDQKETIEDWAYDILERSLYHDWVNNEGGYGWIEVDIENQTYEVDGYARTVVEDGTSGTIE
jgi:hypothetical protein